MWAAESNEGKADSGFKDITGCRAKAPIGHNTFRICISTFLAFPIGSDALLMALRALGSEIGLVFDDILRDVNGGVSFLRSRGRREGEQRRDQDWRVVNGSGMDGQHGSARFGRWHNMLANRSPALPSYPGPALWSGRPL